MSDRPHFVAAALILAACVSVEPASARGGHGSGPHAPLSGPGANNVYQPVPGVPAAPAIRAQSPRLGTPSTPVYDSAPVAPAVRTPATSPPAMTDMSTQHVMHPGPEGGDRNRDRDRGGRHAGQPQPGHPGTPPTASGTGASATQAVTDGSSSGTGTDPTGESTTPSAAPTQSINPSSTLSPASTPAVTSSVPNVTTLSSGGSAGTTPSNVIGGAAPTTLAGCMSQWAADTHMTKAEWRATCVRTLNGMALTNPGTENANAARATKNPRSARLHGRSATFGGSQAP